MANFTADERIALISHAIEGVTIVEAMKLMCSELAAQVAAACEEFGLSKDNAFAETAEALSVMMLACGKAERQLNQDAAKAEVAALLNRMGVTVQ